MSAMLLRRPFTPRRAQGSYERALRDVVGPPGRRPVDCLALLWAHQIAWAAHGTPLLEELDRLGEAARRYDLPLEDVLAELRHQQAAPPVVPAGRIPDATDSVRRLA